MEKDLFEDEDANSGETKSDEEALDVFSYEEEPEKTVEDNQEWLALEDEDLEIPILSEMNADESSANQQATNKKPHLTPPEEKKDIKEEPLPSDEELDAFSGPEDKELAAPPWDEDSEIAEIASTEPAKKPKIFLWIGLLIFVSFLFAGLYVLLQYKQTPADKAGLPEKRALFDKPADQITQSKGPIEIKVPPEEPATQSSPIQVNVAPVVTGTPETVVTEGTLYEFTPTASDSNTEDELTFFIANQPHWLKFDVTTGALRGAPASGNVGDYKDIVILVSDGRAIASLPRFDLTVTKAAQEKTEEKIIDTPKIASDNIPIQKKEKPLKVLVKKEQAPNSETKAYVLPDLKQLILDSKFEEAASEYYRSVKKVPKAFSIKLEVDCQTKSVLLAFQNSNFDPRTFILPKKIGGKNCFVVFWGLYVTNSEAIKALSTIPAFFQQQASKPQLVIVGSYL